VALGGSVEYSEALNRAGFAGVFSIQSSPISLCEALDPETACRNLENTVTELVRLMNLH
jgi:glycerate kinase